MYCQKCGALIHDEAVICVKCGCAVNGGFDIPRTSNKSYRNLIDTITQRIHINAIIWIVIAVIQILLGLAVYWVLLIIGILNIISAIMDLNFCKQIEQKPVGIVEKVKPLAGPIIVLIYNLLIGGVIGVVGSIYYLVGVRNYVMENEDSFLAIERAYAAKSSAANSSTAGSTTARPTPTTTRPASTTARPVSTTTRTTTARPVSTARTTSSRTLSK